MELRRIAAAGSLVAAFGLTSVSAGAQDEPGRSGPERVRASIDGPVTTEAVTRSLRSLVPIDMADEPEGETGPEEVSVMLQIEFEFDSAELTPAAMRDLDQVAAALVDAEMADVPITLEGHTDSSGVPAYNRRLSQRRAEAVLAYLMGHGIAGERLSAVGRGSDQPVDTWSPTDGRQRRVEIVFSF